MKTAKDSKKSHSGGGIGVRLNSRALRLILTILWLRTPQVLVVTRTLPDAEGKLKKARKKREGTGVCAPAEQVAKEKKARAEKDEGGPWVFVERGSEKSKSGPDPRRRARTGRSTLDALVKKQSHRAPNLPIPPFQ